MSRRRVLFVAAFAALIAFSQLRGRFPAEIFPFFSWNLFSHVSSELRIARLRIVRSEGSCFLEACADLSSRARRKTLFFLLQDTAFAGFPSEAVSRLEWQLSRAIAPPFRYEVVFESVRLLPPFVEPSKGELKVAFAGEVRP